MDPRSGKVTNETLVLFAADSGLDDAADATRSLVMAEIGSRAGVPHRAVRPALRRLCAQRLVEVDDDSAVVTGSGAAVIDAAVIDWYFDKCERPPDEVQRRVLENPRGRKPLTTERLLQVVDRFDLACTWAVKEVLEREVTSVSPSDGKDWLTQTLRALLGARRKGLVRIVFAADAGLCWESRTERVDPQRHSEDLGFSLRDPAWWALASKAGDLPVDRRSPEEQREEAVRVLQAHNCNATAAAAELEVDAATVVSRVRAAGRSDLIRPAGNPGGRRVTVAPLAAAHTYQRVRSTAKAAREHGVSESTMRRLLVDAGVTFRKPGVRSDRPDRGT